MATIEQQNPQMAPHEGHGSLSPPQPLEVIPTVQKKEGTERNPEFLPQEDSGKPKKQAAAKDDPQQQSSLQQVPDPQNSAQQSSTPHDDTPQIADDIDLIEKEWVEKAKALIEQTKADPRAQSKEISKFKAKYVKKRFNKDMHLQEE